ncbi:MAG: glycosyltransferase 87 family protein [Nanoarchaeota archaeon]|nr:glycosyltransferase 87 family protein [Nanoarchaeota archaeon]
MNQRTLLFSTVFFAVTLCFLIKLLAFNGVIPWTVGYNDVMPWWTKASAVGMPYVDKPVEYPVIIGMTMHLFSRLGQGAYFLLHYLLYLGLALVSTHYLWKLSEKRGTPKQRLFVFWALAPSMLWFSYFNWDLIAVTFSILALYFYEENRAVLATVFLSLGFATKMYPALFLLPVLLKKPFKEWIKLGLVFGGTFLIVNLPYMLANFPYWSYIYFFHGMREPNPDSIWAVLSSWFGLSTTFINIATGVLFVCLYLFLCWKRRKEDIIETSFLSTLLFLLLNKVFSPQFVLWLLPFFALLGANKKEWYAMEISNLFVLFATLIFLFEKQDGALAWSGFFVVARHLALIALFLAYFKKPSQPLPST